jgi:thiamine-phosphate pyrophosphorylase
VAISGFWTLQRTARLLPARRRLRKALPALLFFTDPVRTPDPGVIAERLPAGSAIVYRAFGAADAMARAMALKQVARRRGLMLIIGRDVALARRVGADGVHLPEALAHRALAIRRMNPGWVVTTAAHSPAAARRSHAHAVVMSVAFPSRSPSAGLAMGPVRLALSVRASGRAVYALGGINDKTACRLLATGVIGMAGVEGLSA